MSGTFDLTATGFEGEAPYAGPEGEAREIKAFKGTYQPSKVTIGLVEKGVLTNVSQGAWAEVEKPEPKPKQVFDIPANIRKNYKKDSAAKQEKIEARRETLDRIEAIKLKKQRLLQLAHARQAKNRTREG